ncbi:hypothetical protein M0R45_011033 [Rubus argutus]|uniref:Mitochondrial transcription termination factor family protein n=1 Tax=Rubus argutus TaxID=59490 RepID=A0AAW1YAG3_RUBAR
MTPHYKSLRSAYPIFARVFGSFRFPTEIFGGRRLISSKISAREEDFTVAYLVKSCGLSPKAAIVASHKVKLQSLEKPDSVLALLRDYELSHTQISNAVQRFPRILVADVRKTLMPKLEFFSSIGLSRLDLAKTLSLYPYLLKPSLRNQLIPNYNFLKRVMVSDVKVQNILKRYPRSFKDNLSKNLIPNIGILRELGIPQSAIAMLLTQSPSIIVSRKPELFRQLVGEVKEMGFDTQKLSFVCAIRALYGTKTTWSLKEEAYRRWGWSENDVLSAFRLFPLCMTLSEKKIMETMDFLVNKMGWQSEAIAKCPMVLCYSLDKRIIPRFSVVRVLCSKGFVDVEKLSLASIITSPEKIFLNRFVTRYLDRVPQLTNVYQGKVYWQDAL